MKKFIISTLVLFTFFLAGGNLYNVHAYAYPQHLNGDTKYILTYGHMGVGYYIDKSSTQIITQDSSGIIYSVKSATGVVLGKGDDWIVPARNVKFTTWIFMRLYDDPWYTVYTFNTQKNTWTQKDLSNTFGYNQTFLGTFAKSWEALTGSSYPNLKR